MKSKKQVLILWLGIFIGLPSLAVIWYQWMHWQGEKDLAAATKQCSQGTSVEKLDLYFNGFGTSVFGDSAFTIRKNSKGIVVDSGKQTITIDKKDGKNSWIHYQYPLAFATTDILEISLGKRKYVLANFKLTVLAFGSMLGAAKVVGCRIDSADINGKRIPFQQNMVIRATDKY